MGINRGSLRFYACIFCMAIITTLYFSASAHALEWAATYGGAENDIAKSLHETSDGGYIVAGDTISVSITNNDFWLIKLDTAGNIKWQKFYDGGAQDLNTHLQLTSDGGYIVIGLSNSFTASYDFWIVRLDGSGNIVWQNTYGTADPEVYPFSIRQTTDDGYIVAGNTATFGAGLNDYWILKLDDVGNVLWHNTYGGGNNDQCYAIEQTSDGGYITAGYTQSFGVTNRGGWIIKLDASGGVDWQKIYGGGSNEALYSIKETSDGGYIAAGIVFVSGNMYDFWVVKLDDRGNIQWKKTYGTTDNELYLDSI